MNSKILVVDDSEIDQKIIIGILNKQSHIVVASTLAEAERALATNDFDLMLLDVELPDGNGFRFLAQVRSQEQTKELPVIFLTQKTEAPDEVMGFSLGAEDYITKPIDPIKTRARIEARLRKIGERIEKSSFVSRGNLKLDLVRQKVSVVTSQNELPLDLTPQEFKVLSYLMRHEDHVLSRDQLIEAVWDNQINIVDRTVDMHMSNLRKKISVSSHTVQSVHGVGYRFTLTSAKAGLKKK